MWDGPIPTDDTKQTLPTTSMKQPEVKLESTGTLNADHEFGKTHSEQDCKRTIPIEAKENEGSSPGEGTVYEGVYWLDDDHDERDGQVEDDQYEGVYWLEDDQEQEDELSPVEPIMPGQAL